MKPYLFIGAVIISLYFVWREPEISRPAGVLAPDEPYQRELYTSSFREKNGYRIAPLAIFDIRTRVIASARYRFGRESDLSPVDLVLGRGAMSDSKVLQQISFSQGGRAYTWWTKAFTRRQGSDRNAQRQYAYDSGRRRDRKSAQIDSSRKHGAS